MAITDKINIDFQYIATGDPKNLIIMDTSVWGFIENKTAIIEILTPGSQNVITYNFEKGKSNVFNSSNLYLSNVGDRNDLPDGIYEITVKGSPDTYCKHRYIIKDDKVKLELYKLYLSLGPNFSEKDNLFKIIQKNKFYLESSHAANALGDIGRASTYLMLAIEGLKSYNECKSC